MKKTLLFGLSLGLGLSSFAQSTVQGTKMAKVDPAKDQAKVFNKKIIMGYETNADAKPASERPSNPIDGSSFQRASTEIVLGETTYDLQTNAAMQDRIHNHGGGNLSAVWTYSTSGDLGAADRGTGYTNFNTTTTAPTQPTARIEDAKTGWPNIDMVNGKEISMAHNIPNSSLTMIQNGGPGSSSWGQTDLNTGDQVWNRMGTNGGSIIHHVSLRAPSGLGGGIFGGVDGAMLYYRSQDGGLTWDISEQFIPGLDASNYSSMGGDSYTLQVRDSIVAVAYWGDMVPTILAKSTDNGDTWEWTSMVNHGFEYDAGSSNTDQALGPIGISDADGDGIADTLDATDGAGAMIIDENGMVHVTYGNMRYIDDTPGDDSWSYFPGTNGLMYWNEGMGENAAVLIMAALDLDGDQQIGGVSFASGSWTGGEYFTSLSGIPHMSLGDDGDIYVAASVYMENIDQGLQNYRHVYITKTSDKGCSWTQQVDVTPQTSAGGLGECVFASLAATDTEVHLVYQRDFEPGLAVRGDEDPFGNNEIVYVNIPVADIDAEPLALCYTFLDEPEYTAMCPGDSVWISTSCGISYTWSNGETTDMVEETIGVHTVSITNACSVTDVHVITLTDATGTVAPDFELDATDYIICNGDSTWLSATYVSDATYQWSNGTTGQTIGIDTAAIYMVTVSNCGGISSDSITIELPALPVALITGASDFCSGDTVSLTAGSEPGALYIWEGSDTTQVFDIDTAGTYEMVVQNCSGSDTTDYTIDFTPAPTATFTVSDNDFCEGTSAANLVAFGGVTYLWSDGSTGQATSVSTVGATEMNVTASNACGDMASATAVTITIFANPATPTLTPSTSGGNLVFTSDAADNAWYIAGSLVQATGDSYSSNWNNFTPGAEVTAVAVDGNGCMSAASAGVIAVAVGIDDEAAASAVNLYPNPNNGIFTIEGNGNYSVTIRNMLGQTIYTGMMNSSTMSFDLSNVNKGVYFVNISNDSFETTEKVVIK
ncbi:MAG: T9SS type A sorting domain-containing protein [Flavobacteriales bacterium]|nr:T9SS type A sorting domain-containing protein [Flavobacteriales bacterium]